MAEATTDLWMILVEKGEAMSIQEIRATKRFTGMSDNAFNETKKWLIESNLAIEVDGNKLHVIGGDGVPSEKKQCKPSRALSGASRRLKGQQGTDEEVARRKACASAGGKKSSAWRNERRAIRMPQIIKDIEEGASLSRAWANAGYKGAFTSRWMNKEDLAKMHEARECFRSKKAPKTNLRGLASDH